MNINDWSRSSFWTRTSGYIHVDISLFLIQEWSFDGHLQSLHFIYEEEALVHIYPIICQFIRMVMRWVIEALYELLVFGFHFLKYFIDDGIKLFLLWFDWGWLVDLVNRFGELEGFQILLTRFKDGPPLSVPLIAALIK